MRGLPLGQGEVWHDPDQRKLLIGIAILAFLPFLGLLLVGTGLFPLRWYFGWVAAPTLLLIAIGAYHARGRYRMLSRRIAVGLAAGWLGAITYDVLFGFWTLFTHAGHPVWTGFVPDVLPGWVGYFNHWLATAALWGLAYGLVAGKARWYYGLAFSLGLWAVVSVVALVLPEPWVLLPSRSLATFGWLLAAHLVYGAVLGGFNEALSPDARRSAKIIFLRDYQARVKERN